MAVFTIGDDSIAGGAPTGGEVGGASNLTTVGAIPYVSASGVLNQDATALFWDAANNRLGVGTASPAIALDVRAAASDSYNGIDTSTIATGVGAGIYLGGYYVGTTPTTWAAIKSGKDNSVSGEYGGFLAFYARAHGAPHTEKARITSTGNFLLATTTDAGYKFDVAGSGSTGTARFKDATPTTGATSVLIDIGAAQTAASMVLTLNGVMKYVGTNSTGAGSALLGANSPALTLSAPYTWLTVITSDGSTGFIPVWK